MNRRRSIGAGLVGLAACILGALASPGALAAESPEEEAGRLVEAGLKDARAKRFAEAAEKFERAVTLHPHPVFFHNLARAHQELGHLPEAHAYFAQALQLNAEYTYAGDARKRMARIETKLQTSHAKVRVTSVPSGAVVVVTPKGSSPQVGLPTPFDRWMPGGPVSLSGSKPGFKTEELAMVVTPGQARTVELILEPVLRKGFLDIATNVGMKANVFINGESVGVAPLKLTKDEGTYALRVEAPGYEPFTREVAVTGDTRVAVLASMVALREPYDPGDGTLRGLGIGMIATGGAALIAGGVMHGLYVGKAQEANDVPPDPARNAEFIALRDEAEDLQVGAIVAYGSAAVIGGLGLYFFLANQASGEPPADGADDGAALRFQPVVDPSQGRVSVEATLRF